MTRTDELARNRATVAGYDACAVSYAAETDHAPFPDQLEALERFAASVGSCGRVLEVASGPGWDADRLEARAEPAQGAAAGIGGPEPGRRIGGRATGERTLTDALRLRVKLTRQGRDLLPCRAAPVPAECPAPLWERRG